MPKKNGKHLQFYMDCMIAGMMPYQGLCRCANNDRISSDILERYFTPEEFGDAITYWASGSVYDFEFKFTPLRQIIVLLMACLNNEL